MRLKTYIETHLENRDIVLNDIRFPVMVDKEKDVAYFPLFNLSGKFIGYQRYNPKGYKGTGSYKIDNELKKYYSYVTKENPDKKVSYIAVYGLHTLDERRYVFVVEGVFDAVKLIRIGEPVIAVLANDPKKLKNFFFVLQKKIIAILDSDKAGRKLKNISHKYYVVPEEGQDLGDMELNDVQFFINKIKEENRLWTKNIWH